MKTYSNPGIFFEETVASSDGANTTVRRPQDLGATGVTGADITVAGFVATTPRGVIGKPVLITNWTEYVNEFGGFNPNSLLAYTIKGFFENGGKKAYIVRATHLSGESTTAVVAQGNVNTDDEALFLTVKAKNEGIWGNDISFEVKEVSEKNFTLNVYYKNVLSESYVTNLDEVETDTEDSKLVDVFVGEAETPKESPLASLTGGDDGISGMVDEDYVKALELLVDAPVHKIAVPGITTLAVHKAMVAFSEKKAKCVPVLDSPLNKSVSEIATYREDLGSSDCIMVYPQLKVADPIGVGKNPTKIVPASGFYIGRMCQMQSTNGAWTAPAGVDATINGIIDLERDVTDSDSAILNPEGIVCLRKFPRIGVVIWGTRSLSNHKDFKYIPVRATVDYIEQSLEDSMKWTNFKANDANLWQMIVSNVSTFLDSIWAQGGLKGATKSEAYTVKCDSELNTQEIIDQGITYCDIGVALTKPNEFTVFRLTINS